MNLQEIKEAVLSGKTVHWASEAYRVINPIKNQWLIICDINKSCVGLTHSDDVTLSDEEEKFFIKH